VGKRIHVVEDSAALTADMLDGFRRELCSRQLVSERAPWPIEHRDGGAVASRRCDPSGTVDPWKATRREGGRRRRRRVRRREEARGTQTLLGRRRSAATRGGCSRRNGGGRLLFTRTGLGTTGGEDTDRDECDDAGDWPAVKSASAHEGSKLRGGKVARSAQKPWRLDAGCFGGCRGLQLGREQVAAVGI
jgi:hypothetical protein